MGLTVQVIWQFKHCGCGPCFSMKEWVSFVWPMRNWDITTCSLLDFLKARVNSPKVGWIWKSLLWMLMSHRCCHFVRRNLLIVGIKSLYGMERTSGLRSKADLAAESAFFSAHSNVAWNPTKNYKSKVVWDFRLYLMFPPMVVMNSITINAQIFL